VFHLATVGFWILFVAGWSTDLAFGPLRKLVPFWILTVVFVSGARVAARMYCHRRPSYLQNTVVVGAGEVGQLVARKLMQHPEYGIKLVGFVDGDARQLRSEVRQLPILGGLDELPEIVKRLEIERVVVAFSRESEQRTLALVRGLDELGVQVDIVPRLFEVVGPNVGIHTVEGIALLGLPPVRLSRSSRWIKRGIDVLGASIGLLLTIPLFAFIAWRIKRTSPGPVFFRQQRLGLNMEPFSMLKFRTMRVDTDDAAHRDYIATTMSSKAETGANGIYKLDRGTAVTSIGRWLRKTSLDELPQLINVLRGEMSLVGPRPCLAYETEHFAPHHFERFVVPPGLTGLWQVTARAHSTFGEALEMDVAYVRGRSLGLDLSLLCRTPLQLGRGRGTT
jgi:exopolysaccharide biosynthesis polyprenyl glycosylphosphotransferase